MKHHMHITGKQLTKNTASSNVFLTTFSLALQLADRLLRVQHRPCCTKQEEKLKHDNNIQ